MSIAGLHRYFSYITRDSPEEGLYVLEWDDFDVIITDLRMPWMNGAEFCGRVRKIKPEIFIYALSGYIEALDSRELGEAGFNGIFSKPIRLELIKDVIEEDLINSSVDGQTG